ncbi:MAG: hypothetical protein Q9184_006283 [Pyrenodesmia sp. 2 TL-2023]
MSFHFNLDLSLAFPPPPPRSRTQNNLPETKNTHDAPENKKGLPGWLQTARQHPHYSPRLFYLIAALIGIILENVVLANISWYSNVNDVHRSAFGPLILGLLWQPLTLFSPRLFRGRQIPNWAIALVETIGCLAFLALIIGNTMAINDDQRYRSSFNLPQVMLVTYASAIWMVLCLLHATLAIQSYAQGWRNVRPKRAVCPHCEGGHGKGKGRASDSEGEGNGETEAGPSEPRVSERYRDEEERGEEM